VQNTLKGPVTFAGQGLHSGQPVRMTISPAAAEHGIWFRRQDIHVGDAMIPARWDAAVHTPLCTRLENGSGASVSTCEHVMAALAGCGVHNVLIEIDGPEVPILDGSAAPFVRAILARGLRSQAAPIRAIEVLREVSVERGCARATLEPSRHLEIAFEIDFADSAIGAQRRHLVMSNGAFVRELCDSRTFCRQADVEKMQAEGFCRGGTLDNAVVVDGDRVLTPGGMRHADEPVRHKMLDALGDLALAGAPILGLYTGEKAGHTLTNMLLRKLMSDPANYRLVICDAAQAARLPGAGVRRAEIPARVSAVA